MPFGIVFAVLSPFVVPRRAGRLPKIPDIWSWWWGSKVLKQTGRFLYPSRYTAPSSHQITERLSSVSTLPVPLIEPYFYIHPFLSGKLP